MRVLRISGGLDPGFGGPANSTVRAAAADARAGHSVVLAFAGSPRGRVQAWPALAWLAAEGVVLRPFQTAPVLGRFGHRFAVSPRLVLWLVRGAGRADVVHLHGAWAVTSIAGLLCARLRRVPTVLTPHESLTDADVATSGTRIRECVKRSMRRVWLATASRIIYSSHLELHESGDYRNRVNATLIPHPVVDERAPAPAGSTIRSADGALRLGFLGRFHEKKNLPMLLEAIALLPSEVTLTISGGGYGSEQALRDIAERLGISHRVTWMGFTQYEDRAHFWESVDVLVVPSSFECFGMVVAEAMEQGVPSIVSDRVGTAELVYRHRAGTVIRPSPQAIKEAVVGYLDHPERLAASSESGRRGALTELTLERYGKAVTTVYQSLTEG